MRARAAHRSWPDLGSPGSRPRREWSRHCPFIGESWNASAVYRCVRFATTVASGHATLATKRTLLLTWAGLAPAGSHQLCLAHSLDHLVGTGENRRRYVKADCLCRLEIDH